MQHAGVRLKIHTILYSENLKEKGHLKDEEVDGTIILIWTGLKWLRIEFCGGIL
jgi:hypothetical protein